MKRFYFVMLLCAVLNISHAQAQMSILFVDDSDDAFGNAELFAAALDSVGFTPTYFNAVDSAATPSDLYMNQFDLVVWTTSNDGGELLLWNGLDEDNASLKAYLDGGGKLWLVGHDFLFDRYLTPPLSFAAGDFVYDYLGISSYDVQTNGDDGGVGVPFVQPSENSPITGLNNLNFIFATYYWMDGVSLVEGALPVYEMGGEGYVLEGTPSGIYYDNGTSQALTYFFDLGIVANFELLKETVLPVMNHFNALISNIENVLDFEVEAKVFPNPSLGDFQLQLELEKSAHVSISVLDLQGRTVQKLMPIEKLSEGKHNIEYQLQNELQNGYHFLYINIDGVPVMRPLMIER